MNAPTTPSRAPSTTPSSAVVPFPSTSRLAPRERDFGVGYGKSSGYAASRRYVAPSQSRYFRFA
jgi:hypothetical protein